MKILLIDIGGTNIKYALSTPDGVLSEKGSMPTGAKKGADKVFSNVCGLVDRFTEDHALDGLAISTAGQVDADTGAIIYATEGIPGYTGYRLRDRLTELYGLKVSVENDVNCAALGEMWKREMSSHSFIALTIGTGIGGAIVMDGSVYHGATGSAGEIGHMTLVSGGEACNCGHRGCFERYASAQALEKQVRARLGDVSMADFFERLRQDDKAAHEVYDTWIGYLTDGLRSLVHIFNPSTILIGGGITVQGDYLRSAIVEGLKGKIMASFAGPLSIELMELGNDANLYGALYWFVESEMDGHAI